MKFQVRQTKQNGIEVSKFELLDTGKTRSLIALNILGACFLFLIGATVYSLWQDDFAALKEVLKYISTPIGTITGYYFGVKS